MNKRTLYLLVVEDDPSLGPLLVDALATDDLNVVLIQNGEEALLKIKERHFDFYVLDVMLPKLDGFSLAKTIRAINTHAPILFITAKGQKSDKLTAYAIGADDYITKPFDFDELQWKIKAVKRRLFEHKINNAVVAMGSFNIDFENLSLTSTSGIKRITAKESAILKCLYEHRNQIVKREKLLIEIWGSNDYFFGRSLDVFIAKLRKYLKQDARVQIETVFKVGFILHMPE